MSETSEKFNRLHGELIAEIEKAHIDVKDISAIRALACKVAENDTDIIEDLVSRICSLGPLDNLLSDPDITEIMVNGTESVFIEKNGKLERAEANFADEEEILRIINRIVGKVGRRIDESVPFVDARLPDGSRVNAIIHPLSLTGPALTIRRFPKEPFTLEKLVGFGTLNNDLAAFLKACIRAKRNIVISGGTGSGKTSTLNALIGEIPEGERIITIEDAAEMRITHPHRISLESRCANIENAGEITIRTLLKNALRMRPDRIIVGEIRGGEAIDMLQAMNTGHQGSITTVHANAPQEALSRIETMAKMTDFDLPLHAIREQINSALDLIVHQERLPGGSRKIVAVYEISKPHGKLVPLFEYDKSTGEFVKKNEHGFLKEFEFYGAQYAG